jgi:hypothetical protein
VSGPPTSRKRTPAHGDPKGGKDLVLCGLLYEDEAEGAYYNGRLVARDPASAGLLGDLAKAAERTAILCRGTATPVRPPHLVPRGRPLPKRYRHDNHKLHSPVPAPTCAPSRPASSVALANGPFYKQSVPCQTQVADVRLVDDALVVRRISCNNCGPKTPRKTMQYPVTTRDARLIVVADGCDVGRASRPHLDAAIHQNASRICHGAACELVRGNTPRPPRCAQFVLRLKIDPLGVHFVHPQADLLPVWGELFTNTEATEAGKALAQEWRECLKQHRRYHRREKAA